MRYGKKWTINEILSLEREYTLLEWTVQQIAKKHKRSIKAILCKLEAEAFIDSWNEARGFYLDSYIIEETKQTTVFVEPANNYHETSNNLTNLFQQNVDFTISDEPNNN